MATVPQIRIDRLVAEQGFTGALDAVLARVEAWPTSPTDPKYAIRVKLARQFVPVAASWSAKSRTLLVGVRGHIEEWAGSPSGNPYLAALAINQIVIVHNLMLTAENELTAYAAAGGGLDRLKTISIRLLANARTGYRVAEEYRSTWWYKLTSLIAGAISLLQKVVDLVTAILNAIADLIGGLTENLGWLKWVALGLGGIWAYDKLWGKKSTS